MYCVASPAGKRADAGQHWQSELDDFEARPRRLPDNAFAVLPGLAAAGAEPGSVPAAAEIVAAPADVRRIAADGRRARVPDAAVRIAAEDKAGRAVVNCAAAAAHQSPAACPGVRDLDRFRPVARSSRMSIRKKQQRAATAVHMHFRDFRARHGGDGYEAPL